MLIFIYTLDIFLYQSNYDSNIFRRFKKKTKPIFVLRKQIGFSVEIVYFELSRSLDGPSITDKGYTSDKSLNLNSTMPHPELLWCRCTFILKRINRFDYNKIWQQIIETPNNIRKEIREHDKTLDLPNFIIIYIKY